jgi:hypothetical protein
MITTFNLYYYLSSFFTKVVAKYLLSCNRLIYFFIFLSSRIQVDQESQKSVECKSDQITLVLNSNNFRSKMEEKRRM